MDVEGNDDSVASEWRRVHATGRWVGERSGE